MGFVTLGIFVLNIQGIEEGDGDGESRHHHRRPLPVRGHHLRTTHSRQILDNTGLAGPMPRYALFLMIFALSSLGLPGTNSFAKVGEFLVLAGTFVWSQFETTLAALGVILAAAYMLWLMQRMVFGTPAAGPSRHLDLNVRETATLIPLIVLVFALGIFQTRY